MIALDFKHCYTQLNESAATRLDTDSESPLSQYVRSSSQTLINTVQHAVEPARGGGQMTPFE